MPSPLPVSRPFFSPHPCSLSSLRISWALYNFTRPVKTLRVEWLMPRFGAHSLLADLHLREVSSIASRQYAPRVAKSLIGSPPILVQDELSRIPLSTPCREFA